MQRFDAIIMPSGSGKTTFTNRFGARILDELGINLVDGDSEELPFSWMYHVLHRKFGHHWWGRADAREILAVQARMIRELRPAVLGALGRMEGRFKTILLPSFNFIEPGDRFQFVTLTAELLAENQRGRQRERDAIGQFNGHPFLDVNDNRLQIEGLLEEMKAKGLHPTGYSDPTPLSSLDKRTDRILDILRTWYF